MTFIWDQSGSKCCDGSTLRNFFISSVSASAAGCVAVLTKAPIVTVCVRAGVYPWRPL